MKTISMSAFNRPAYTRQVLESLGPALIGHDEWRLGRFRTDWSRDEEERLAVWEVSRDIFDFELDNYRIYSGWSFSAIHRGCDENIRVAVAETFQFGSVFNLHLEDDTVLAPDALDLCDWFYKLPERDEYACLNLFSGWKDQLSRPLEMAEEMAFSSWGWAITREKWERHFLPEWNCKGGPDRIGWDWSMNYIIQRDGLKVLRPVLSRIRNIGREGGTYETPEHWDAWAKDLPLSDGSYGSDFRITMPLPEDYRTSKMDDWAREEIARQQSAK